MFYIFLRFQTVFLMWKLTGWFSFLIVTLAFAQNSNYANYWWYKCEFIIWTILDVSEQFFLVIHFISISKVYLAHLHGGTNVFFFGPNKKIYSAVSAFDNSLRVNVSTVHFALLFMYIFNSEWNGCVLHIYSKIFFFWWHLIVF